MTSQRDERDVLSDSASGQPASAVRVSTLALLLVELDPAIPGRLLREHIPDARGACRGCTLPQSGSTRWPCTLHALAVEAERVRASRVQARARESGLRLA